MRRSSVAFALGLVFLFGCQSGAGAGTACSTTSSCGAPLVCRLGRCRNACAQNRDCPAGSQCFLDASGLGACQLDVDRSCGADACGSGLTCLLGACVRACSQPSDCPTDGMCTTATGAAVGVCSDPRSAGDAGPIDAAQSDAGPIDAGPIDAGPIDAGSDARSSVDASTSCAPLAADHVCTGLAFSCAIRTDTTVVCWGEGEAGILGRLAPVTNLCSTRGVTTPCELSPVEVQLETTGDPLMGAQELACGEDFACARLTGGGVRCWGRNYRGMLGAPGDVIFGAREVVDAGGLPVDGATQIVAGGGYACVLRGPASVWCWGMDDTSQIGGAPAPFITPSERTDISSIGGVTRLVAMSADACVVHTGMTTELWCIGNNLHGQLGIDPTTTPSSPVLVHLDMLTLGPSSIVAGADEYACAIGADQHIQCWGWNTANSLGRNDLATSGEITPAPLYGPASALAFAGVFGGSSAHTACGISTDGLYCWGANGSGQAGQNPATDAINATRVTNLPPIVEGSCGEQHCCAVDASHTVWCWGANDVGQMGRGTTSASEWRPSQVCAP